MAVLDDCIPHDIIHIEFSSCRAVYRTRSTAFLPLQPSPPLHPCAIPSVHHYHNLVAIFDRGVCHVELSAIFASPAFDAINHETPLRIFTIKQPAVHNRLANMPSSSSRISHPHQVASAFSDYPYHFPDTNSHLYISTRLTSSYSVQCV